MNVDYTRVPAYFHQYINQVSESSLDAALADHLTRLKTYLEALESSKWNYRYAPGKWSIKEVVQHMIDAERIFCYRALCIARQEAASLPGFDENAYALYSGADNRTPASLLEELESVQRASVTLFKSFTEGQLEAGGTANGKPTYVRALGYILIGHARHHLAVLQERYS